MMAMSYLDTYRRSIEQPEAFWSEAAEAIAWERRWERVLDTSRPPFYRWFVGARLNTCWNALDRHIAAMSCTGFITTFQRGAEWAATGQVTQSIPASFPSASAVTNRADIALMDPASNSGPK